MWLAHTFKVSYFLDGERGIKLSPDHRYCHIVTFPLSAHKTSGILGSFLLPISQPSCGIAHLAASERRPATKKGESISPSWLMMGQHYLKRGGKVNGDCNLTTDHSCLVRFTNIRHHTILRPVLLKHQLFLTLFLGRAGPMQDHIIQKYYANDRKNSKYGEADITDRRETEQRRKDSAGKVGEK